MFERGFVMAKYYALVPKCQTCKEAQMITGVSFNSECHTQINVLCATCGNKTTLNYSLITLKEWADNQEFKEENENRAVLLANSRTEKATDDAFLRSMHIHPDQPKLIGR